MRAMTRKPESAAALELKKSGAQVVAGDLEDRGSIERAAKGVDVAFESSGRNETYAAALGCVKSGGSVVAVGLSAASTTIPVELNRFVRKGIRLLGSYGARPRQDMPELLDLVNRGILNTKNSVTGRFSLMQVNDALNLLERGEIVGRSILVL